MATNDIVEMPPQNDPVERIAWALISELYRDEPDEAKRPKSWRDLRRDEEQRVMCAAALAFRMSQQPNERHTELTINRRHARAMKVTGHIMQVIEKLMDHEQMRYVSHKIFETLYLDGIEVITESDRIAAGLSPRDHNGLTREELAALDARMLHAMLTPMVPFLVPEPNKKEAAP